MEVKHLNHSTWYCKYHAVWIPKCRRKKLFAALRSKLGDVFHELARQKESVIEKGHLTPDHVHILISIPPKLAVASVLGYSGNNRPRQVASTRILKALTKSGQKPQIRYSQNPPDEIMQNFCVRIGKSEHKIYKNLAKNLWL